jgi:hypothetical protein
MHDHETSNMCVGNYINSRRASRSADMATIKPAQLN